MTPRVLPPARSSGEPPLQAAERGGGALDGLDLGFTAVFILVAVWSWVGITLAETGLYRGLWLATLGGAGSLAGWWAFGRVLCLAPITRARTREAAWLALWIVLAAWLVWRPGEFLINGDDGSVYLNGGRALQRHGALVFSEPVLELVDRSDWPALFHMGSAWPRVYHRFPGGVQLGPDEQQVRLGFFHLFMVWVAHLEWIAIGGGRFASPVFAVLGVMALWMLARRLSSLTTANVAAGLLTIHFAQIWFGRLPSSEILTQFLILSGLYFATLSARWPTAFAGACTGLAFGLAAFARIDALVLATPLVAAYLLLSVLRSGWNPTVTGATAAFGLVTVQALAHALTVAAPYTLRVLNFLFATDWESPVALALPPALVAAGFAAYLAWQRESVIARRVTRAIVLLIAGAAILRLWPAMNGGYLTMALTPPGLALGVAGVGLMVVDDDRPHVLLVAGLLAASFLVYAESVRDRQLVPWLFRRFVPVILPLALLASAYALSRIAALRSRVRLAAPIMTLVLAGLFLSQSQILWGASPMQGLRAQVAAVANTAAPGAVFLVDETPPSHLGLSLQYTFGRDVLWIRATEGTAAALGRLAESADRAGRPLVLAVGPGPRGPSAFNPHVLARLEVAPIRVASLAHDALESSADRVPKAIRRVSPEVHVYVARRRMAVRLPLEMEVGEMDLQWRLSGFHDAEQMGNASARWSAGLASLALPDVTGLDRAAIVVRAAAPRPPGLAAPRIELAIGNRVLGRTAPLGPGFQIVEVPVPPWAAARLSREAVVLTLRTPPFVPRDHGMGNDARQLGAAIDWVRLEAR